MRVSLSKRTLLALVVAAVAVAASVAGAAGVARASAKAPLTAVAAHPWQDPLTGYPTHINQIDLTGYVIDTSYPLGLLDAGSTYRQTYSAGGNVSALPIAGPYLGSAPTVVKYIALPVTKTSFLLVWLEPNFQHNTLVFNLVNHEVSVVTYDQAGDPSLGTFKIIKYGKHPIP